jgi:hypothetical protein
MTAGKKMVYDLCSPGKHRILAKISDDFSLMSNAFGHFV